MSSQQELNLNFPEYILYWCNVTNADPTVYSYDLKEVCSPYYDENNNIQVRDWIPAGYPAPTSADMLAHSYADVHQFYQDFYTVPAAISEWHYKITTADLNRVRTDASMIGFMVFDLNTRGLKRWSGSAWVSI